MVYLHFFLDQKSMQYKALRPSIGLECRFFSPLPVTLSSVSDLVGSDDDDDDEETIEFSVSTKEEYILSMGDLEDQTASSSSSEGEQEMSSSFAHQLRLQEARAAHKRHETDTGSPEYQVASMTERIAYLTTHLVTHPKDFSTRRGLVALVNKRRRLLNYLSMEDVGRYKELIASLGIRHKAVGLVPTKEEKYGNFPPQKKPKSHGPGSGKKK
jgi:small subunit ribosomal protein S15